MSSWRIEMKSKNILTYYKKSIKASIPVKRFAVYARTKDKRFVIKAIRISSKYASGGVNVI